jgi:hypothetical protein
LCLMVEIILFSSFVSFLFFLSIEFRFVAVKFTSFVFKIFRMVVCYMILRPSLNINFFTEVRGRQSMYIVTSAF